MMFRFPVTSNSLIVCFVLERIVGLLLFCLYCRMVLNNSLLTQAPNNSAGLHLLPLWLDVSKWIKRNSCMMQRENHLPGTVLLLYGDR
jgi:hypothetical protein